MSVVSVDPSFAAPGPSLSVPALVNVVRELSLDQERWRSKARHTRNERWFTRVAAHPDHDVWLIGWSPYQGVDLHDHGGSSGVLYVVEGELVETATPRDGTVRLEQQHLLAGTARAFGPRHVHRVVNTSSRNATSLHVYSPPLTTMDFYAPEASTLAPTHTEPAFGPRSGRGELR